MAVPPEGYISFFSGIGALDLAVRRVFGGARVIPGWRPRAHEGSTRTDRVPCCSCGRAHGWRPSFSPRSSPSDERLPTWAENDGEHSRHRSCGPSRGTQDGSHRSRRKCLQAARAFPLAAADASALSSHSLACCRAHDGHASARYRIPSLRAGAPSHRRRSRGDTMTEAHQMSACADGSHPVAARSCIGRSASCDRTGGD